jgi:hypothetical protein
MEEIGHLEDPSINGREILRWIRRKCDGDMHWIGLAQDRDKRRAFVTAVMNVRIL